MEAWRFCCRCSVLYLPKCCTNDLKCNIYFIHIIYQRKCGRCWLWKLFSTWYFGHRGVWWSEFGIFPVSVCSEPSINQIFHLEVVSILYRIPVSLGNSKSIMHFVNCYSKFRMLQQNHSFFFTFYCFFLVLT